MPIKKASCRKWNKRADFLLKKGEREWTLNLEPAQLEEHDKCGVYPVSNRLRYTSEGQAHGFPCLSEDERHQLRIEQPKQLHK